MISVKGRVTTMKSRLSFVIFPGLVACSGATQIEPPPPPPEPPACAPMETARSGPVVFTPPYTFVAGIEFSNVSKEEVSIYAPVGTLMTPIDGRSQVLALLEKVDEKVPAGASVRFQRLGVCVDRHSPVPDICAGYRLMDVAHPGCRARIEQAYLEMDPHTGVVDLRRVRDDCLTMMENQ